MQKKIDLEIAARLDDKVVMKKRESFDFFVNYKVFCWNLLSLVYQLEAMLRYIAVMYGFNTKPKIGHLVITVSCGETAETLLDIHGVLLVKVGEINDLLGEKELFMKLINLFLHHLED